MRYLLAAEIGGGRYKPTRPGPPGEPAAWEYIAVFDLVQPAETFYCSAVRTECRCNLSHKNYHQGWCRKGDVICWIVRRWVFRNGFLLLAPVVQNSSAL